MPTTSGTATVCGPCETLTTIVAPFSTSPGPGLVLTTVPGSGNASLRTSLRWTLKPWPSMAALALSNCWPFQSTRVTGAGPPETVRSTAEPFGILVFMGDQAMTWPFGTVSL